MSDHRDSLRNSADQPGHTESGGSASGVQTVDIAGVASLPIVVVDGEPLILFARAMELLGLNAEAQLRTLRQREWAEDRTVRIASPGEAQTRRVVVVPEDVFIGHCVQIRVASVRADRGAALRAFQRESIRALAAYWTRGIAVNPRGRSADEVALLENGPAVLVALDHLFRAHRHDQMGAPRSAGIGVRDLPDGMTRAGAQRRALAEYRRGYAALAGPVLRLGRAPGLRLSPDGEAAVGDGEVD